MKRIVGLVFLTLLIFVFSSCQQRYFFFPFPDGSSENVSGDSWDGTVDTSWYLDESQKVYTFDTAEELAGLAYLINNGTSEFEDVTINLMSDIDLSGEVWEPIGGEYSGSDGFYNEPDTNVRGFRGTFNGNGHTIYNLTIERQTEDSNNISYENSFLGLFAILESGSSVSNLNFHNVRLVGDCFIGPLAGYIPSAPDTESVEPVHISNINVTGQIELIGKFTVGGVIGRVESARSSLFMTNCNVTADAGSYIMDPDNLQVYLDSSYFGGIIGAAYSSVNNVFDNCSVSGLDITGNLDGVGGLAGLANPAGTLSFNSCRVSDCDLEIKKLDESSTVSRAYTVGVFVGEIPNVSNKEVAIPASNSISNVTITYPFAQNQALENRTGLIGGILSTWENPQVNYEGLDVSGVTFYYN